MSNIIIILALALLGFFLFRKLKKPKLETKQFSAAHDCGMRALIAVMPDLSHDKIYDAFIQCAEKWPNGGVSNVDYNIALRYMKIFDKFEYNDAEKQKMGDFTSDIDSEYILLIHGHFTTIKKGKIIDSPYYSDMHPNQKVYCSWKLIR